MGQPHLLLLEGVPDGGRYVSTANATQSCLSAVDAALPTKSREEWEEEMFAGHGQWDHCLYVADKLARMSARLHRETAGKTTSRHLLTTSLGISDRLAPGCAPSALQTLARAMQQARCHRLCEAIMPGSYQAHRCIGSRQSCSVHCLHVDCRAPHSRQVRAAARAGSTCAKITVWSANEPRRLAEAVAPV